MVQHSAIPPQATTVPQQTCESPAPNRPNALAISLGAEGLGQLPSGIGAPDPQAPVDYALNILMTRFITLSTLKSNVRSSRHRITIHNCSVPSVRR